MIVAQSRGAPFFREDDGSWKPNFGVANESWDDMEDAFDDLYGQNLTVEGVGFRQRFVAFVEAADGS